MSTYASVREMALRHNVSEATVRRRVESGDWPAGRDGKLVRFSPEDQETIARRIASAEPTESTDDLLDRAVDLLSGRAA